MTLSETVNQLWGNFTNQVGQVSSAASAGFKAGVTKAQDTALQGTVKSINTGLSQLVASITGRVAKTEVGQAAIQSTVDEEIGKILRNPITWVVAAIVVFGIYKAVTSK